MARPRRAVDARAQDERSLATDREGVLPEGRQLCARADRRGDLRRGREPRCRLRARFDLAVAPLALACFCFRPLALGQIEHKRAEAEARESERRYREVQMELAHANRVATLGQLTASISHEVNQPIAAAVTYA